MASRSQRKSRKIGGESYIVRYADDFVVCFQYKMDAERFLQEVRVRLEKFGIGLHPDKTRLIEFGRDAEGNRRERGEGRPKTFDFLGFTHYCRKNPIGKNWTGAQSNCEVYGTLSQTDSGGVDPPDAHDSVHATGKWLGQVLNGWLNYYAVPWSYPSLRRCYKCLKWIWLCTLRRRSQKDRTTWAQVSLLSERYWPKLKIRHDWPARRFAVTHVSATQGRSRMR